MWDDRRKVGILNDFDLARFADHTGASRNDSTGTLPFMALDLLSEEGLRGVIPRRYRHEAESFAWSFIYLHLATMVNKHGKNLTVNPHPLRKWFEDWRSSRVAKIALQWHDYDHLDAKLSYPNAKELACALHTFWMKRFNQQFPKCDLGPGPRIRQLFGRETPDAPRAPPPYQEPDDDMVFEDALAVHELSLGSMPLKEFGELLFKMAERFQRVNQCT